MEESGQPAEFHSDKEASCQLASKKGTPGTQKEKVRVGVIARGHTSERVKQASENPKTRFPIQGGLMSRYLSAVCLVCGVLYFTSGSARGQILGTHNEMFDLVLVPTDLKEATRQMTIYDLDDDGSIDREERERLPWKDVWEEFDLSRDGKLTHIEIAVRQAKLRARDDITEFDINNVSVFLARYDNNRNGQLDPDEVSRSGWPSDPDDYDGNGDGTLTLRELATRFAYNRGLRREMGIEAVDNVGASQWIRRFDKNGDKKLDADERTGIALPKPAEQFDDDDDGMLGAMELATMLAKHRKDAGLTKPDTRKIQILFSRLDTDGDGNIDVSMEKTGGPENTSGGVFAGPNLQAILKYDTDGNGTVTIGEVEKQFAKVRRERGYTEREFDMARKMITRHDGNRSKHIELSELFDTASPGKLPKSLMSEADRNGDGKLGLDELSRYFAKQND